MEDPLHNESAQAVVQVNPEAIKAEAPNPLFLPVPGPKITTVPSPKEAVAGFRFSETVVVDFLFSEAIAITETSDLPVGAGTNEEVQAIVMQTVATISEFKETVVAESQLAEATTGIEINAVRGIAEINGTEVTAGEEVLMT